MLTVSQVLTVMTPNVMLRLTRWSDMIHTYMCDVSRLAEVEAIALKVCEEVRRLLFFVGSRPDESHQVGNPTMLVNNAGVVKGKLLLDLTEGDVTE